MSKGLRVLGHPLHAILSDFPLALLGTSLFWDAVALWRGESVWWVISFWNIALGLAAALVAAGVGMYDYAAIEQGHPAQSTGLRHMLFMFGMLGVYGTSLVVRGGSSPPSGRRLLAVLTLEGVGLFLLSAGGWYGGHLVFHHGIGRDAIAKDGGTYSVEQVMPRDIERQERR
ncbi:MAG: DUF2231 domain-containing protein [Acidobacteriota bacterium]|nr:DUF2231 domain-containing protein [Acidobacteriota bacterium]